MLMKKLLRVLLSGLFILSLMAGRSWAQQARFSRQMAESQRAHKSYAQFVKEFMEQNKEEVKIHRKAPRALLLSAAIPGLGQLYNKSYLKSGIFATIEVASWFVYFNQTSKGNRLDAEFKEFADAHWDPARYWQALANESGCDLNDTDCLKQFEQANFSHHLPDVKNQTYYENIGKYNQFNIGWDDAQQHRARDSALREHYTIMRKQSNDAFELARAGATVVILNHLVSALEAAFTAHKQDMKLHGSLNVEPRRYRNEMVPALALRLKW